MNDVSALQMLLQLMLIAKAVQVDPIMLGLACSLIVCHDGHVTTLCLPKEVGHCCEKNHRGIKVSSETALELFYRTMLLCHAPSNVYCMP